MHLPVLGESRGPTAHFLGADSWTPGWVSLLKIKCTYFLLLFCSIKIKCTFHDEPKAHLELGCLIWCKLNPYLTNALWRENEKKDKTFHPVGLEKEKSC